MPQYIFDHRAAAAYWTRNCAEGREFLQEARVSASPLGTFGSILDTPLPEPLAVTGSVGWRHLQLSKETLDYLPEELLD